MSSFCEVKCKGNALGTGARFAKQPNKDPSLTRAQKKFILFRLHTEECSVTRIETLDGAHLSEDLPQSHISRNDEPFLRADCYYASCGGSRNSCRAGALSVSAARCGIGRATQERRGSHVRHDDSISDVLSRHTLYTTIYFYVYFYVYF